jgi:DmsE family decaheme c-type cytochrome
MIKESVNETCYSCHMEYRGPFLWSHTPVTQDCTICHNPHGTTTAGMLKLRPPFLCQQCHEPNSHRGNFPGLAGIQRTAPPGSVNNPNYNNTNFPDSGGLTQGRGCVNCHTNIHGGSNATNLPVGVTNQRSFRR